MLYKVILVVIVMSRALAIQNNDMRRTNTTHQTSHNLITSSTDEDSKNEGEYDHTQQPHPSKDPKDEYGYDYEYYVAEYSNLLINAKTGTLIFIVIIGIASNSLSILIIVKRGLIKVGIWVYIACLAFSDNCVLVMYFLYEFSKEPVNYFGSLLNASSFNCRLIYILFSVFLVVSNNTLACMTLERCVTILRPYRPPPSQRRAFIMVSCIVVYALLLYTSYYSVVYGLVHIPIGNNETLTFCTPLLKYEKYNDFFLWTDLGVFLLIPSTAIIFGNLSIILTLIKRSRNKAINRNDTKVKHDMKITYMLLAISSFFVLAVAPNSLYGTLLWQYFYTDPLEAFSFDNIPWSIMVYLNLANFSGNFFLYCITGQTFRQEAKNFFWHGFRCDETTNTPSI